MGLKRKTPLKRGTSSLKRTPISRGDSTLKTRTKLSPKSKRKGRSAQIADAQAVFNKLVKIRAAKPSGRVSCYTCGRVMHWTEMHAGHYFHALAHPALRFHENNVKPQCPVCNTTLAGNLNVYKQKLIFELGEDGFSAMELMSLKSAKHRNLAEKVKTWQTEINERQNNIDNLSGS